MTPHNPNQREMNENYINWISSTYNGTPMASIRCFIRMGLYGQRYF